MVSVLAAATVLAACSVGVNGSGSAGGSSASGTDAVTFAGKTITLVAPFAAGGSADVLARLTATQLSDFLPGKPTVVVKNMDGGGGSVGLNYVANLQPANGLTLGFFGAGMATRYIAKTAGFDDLPDQPLIGGFPQGLVQPVRAALGTDIPTLQKSSKPLRVAETSAGGTGALSATIGDGLLGIPIKQIFGFSGGGADAATSMLSGETDAAQTADTSYDQTFQPYVKSGKFNALFQTGIMNSQQQIVRSPLAPNVPTILEIYQQLHPNAQPSGELWTTYQLAANLNTSNYVLAARKGTPDNIMSTVRTAFNKMAASDGWKTFTQSKLTVPLATTDATVATKSWNAFLDSSPEQVALFKKYSGLK
ncbi:tripartite tricarboxylate transporter substrate binding protein [Rugosimonospora acidiphila]|uniref:Tripartite tricarboxylate transporter substrate binding protein n=1 Tax=Rugosimonospora acidiphila TaxID=556531 RepID=A0ABP9SRQ8_9ACTN